ncbi:hypothetical protein [Tahibacter harae]|uniref:Outer membrane protein assembly factor BamB n=1 Tax=Tahibacter harae TaxID=2963937 RepID=A0ABT1QTJ1_9GAMM|nr:hypothetical protein [Tahibacter harae]MCQ4165600.1 hypothetical protein [Tahibacter harae]
MYRSALLLAAVIALAGLFAVMPAAAVSPQWMVNVENLVRTQEQPLADLGASWTLLADGSQLLAAQSRTAEHHRTLRRITPDGQISDFGQFTPGGHGQLPETHYGDAARVLLAAAQTGAWVLTSSTGETTGSQLQFLEADGRLRWSLPLPSNAADGDGPAVALSAQADGSALVLRKRSVLKVDASGQIKWHFGNGNADHVMLDQAVLAVDSLGVSWVGGGGGLRLGADHLKFAAVRRFDSQGALLSLGLLLCDSCTHSRVLGLALLPNGEAAVVGRSGAGEPGFFAMFGQYGAQRLRVFTAPGGGYDHVVADAANNVYALARDTGTVSAIDPANGSVRWQKSGSDISALPEGVLIAQAPTSGTGALTISAFGADGTTQWTRQIEASDGTALGGARYEDGVTRVVAMVERESADCGFSPGLVTLDAAGVPQSTVRACTVPVRRYWRGISSDPSAGIVGHLDRRMLRFDAYGKKRWDYDTCPFCPGYASSTYTGGSRLMPDGTAWITTRYYGTAGSLPSEHKLLRLAAGGSVLGETPLPLPGEGALWDRTQVLADADQVVVLVPQRGGVSWSRASSSGSPLAATTLPLPGDHDQVELLNSRLWPDGSVSLVTQRYYLYGCEADPPPEYCYDWRNTVLRINADGSERWRADLDRKWLNASIEDDGSHVVLVSAMEFGESVLLRQIDAKGNVSAAVPIPDSTDGSVGHVIGPVRGRYLFSTHDGFRLVDRNDNLVATRASQDFGNAVAYAEPGFIVSSSFYTGRLLSADDLTELARFDTDGPDLYPHYDTYWEHWSLSDDGSVYLSEQPGSRNGYRPRLICFAVPGSPADDVIFIDRF